MKARPHRAAIAAALLFAGWTAAGAQRLGMDTGLRSGLPDKAILHSVSRCLAGTLSKPVDLYSRGGWFISDDLREDLRERQGDIEAIAMVWKLRNVPRAVYQWNHDDEFNRDVVACLNADGMVIRSESRYAPGDSEPDQRWMYVHTLSLTGHPARLQGAGRFTDWRGNPRGRPHMTPEDEDFIAGERVYRRWTDFDFANLVGAQER